MNVQIETINSCNASCYFCPVKNLKRKRELMPKKLFSHIIDELINSPPEYIYPFLNGEPFLDKRMMTFLEEINIKLPETKLIIFTNGSLIKPELLKIKNLHQIWFSINALPENYYTLVGLDYEKTMKTIDEFLLAKAEMKHSDKIKTIASFVNAERFYDQIALTWAKKVDQIFFSPIKNFAGLIDIPPDTNRRLEQRCKRVSDYLTILVDGTVALCCMDAEGQISFGNVKETSIKEIWNSKLRLHYEEMHKASRWDKLELCRICTGA